MRIKVSVVVEADQSDDGYESRSELSRECKNVSRQDAVPELASLMGSLCRMIATDNYSSLFDRKPEQEFGESLYYGTDGDELVNFYVRPPAAAP